jgi:NADPH:quinone reductase-like Zn-dependent oxidoreductase
LAKRHGARVTATASAKNLDFVKSLGAEQAIDYRATRFDDVVKDVDAVLDTVGGETLERSWRVLGPGGRLVTVVSTAAGSSDERVKKAFFIVEPNQKQLTRIAELLEKGALRTTVDAVLPLAKAPEAYNESAPRRGRGKIVVSISG